MTFETLTVCGKHFLLASILAVPFVAGHPVRAQQTAKPPSPGTPQPPAATRSAQEPPVAQRKWELSVHGGLLLPLQEGSGSGTLPTTGAIARGLVSASTFYFGQGASLFNQNQATPAIAPLDPVLSSRAIGRQRTLVVGARLERTFRPRLGLEIAGEYRRGDLAFRSGAVTQIDASARSLKPALDGVLARFPVPTSTASTATLIDNQRSTQLSATAALLLTLRDTGRARPYVVLGGGVVLDDSTTPRAALVGSTRIGDPAQIIYTDNVVLRYQEQDRLWVGIAGGGVKLHLSSRWGLRFDARANVYRNTVDNLVDVGAVTALQSTGQPFPILTSGTLQFSPTSPLSGVPIGGAVTSSGSGLQLHGVVSSGIFLRF